MHVILAILAIILRLLLIVGVHEAGHAIAARWFGVNVQSITIGLGRSLCHWKYKKLEWHWALWPLGGSVQLLNSRIAPVNLKDCPYCFDKNPAWQRMIILFAGIGANIFIAWLSLTCFFLLDHLQNSPVISSVQTNSIATQAQLNSGDEILVIANQSVSSWQDAAMQLLMRLGQSKVSIIVKIRGKPISVALEILLHRLALIFLCLILIQLLLNDLQNYWR